MADADEHEVEGDIEYLVEQGFVEALCAYSDVTDILGSTAPNVRRAGDTSSKRKMPGLAVDAMVEQAVPRTNEYHARVQIVAATSMDDDPDGQDVQALIGAARNLLHTDRTSGGFTGDCEGIVQTLNAQDREIIYHQIHEGDTFADDEGRTRRLVMNVDAWGYPGS